MTHRFDCSQPPFPPGRETVDVSGVSPEGGPCRVEGGATSPVPAHSLGKSETVGAGQNASLGRLVAA